MIQFILLLVGLILLFLLLAKVIVEYVPKKVHWIISLLLLFTAVYLGYKIYDGVVGNIKFHQEKKVRYAKVIKKLKVIREAELAFKKVKGIYSKDFNELVHFIETDSFPELITLEKSKEIEDRGVKRVIEYQEIDTIGFTKVLESFKNKDYKDMMNVPGTKAKFELATGFVEKGAAAIKTPVFEAKVAKRIVLEGITNKNLIEQEVTVFSVDQVRGEFISVGNLDDVKDSGNWPPSYDTAKKSDAK
jgi:hypothetical protein